MKILRIKIRNIHSLKGDHEINFEQAPLADSGLFAITGETGAGKTTILDALCLALYGKTPRHDSSKNRDEQNDGLMTKGTFEALAEVDFETDAGRRRAEWRVHRSKRSKKIQSDKRRIYALNEQNQELGEVITERKDDVKAKIRELTGLDFEHFRRSVMLAQGDFARFLQAGKKEKAEILEKITGTNIYSELSKRAFDKQKQENEKLENLRRDLENSENLLDEETFSRADAKKGLLEQKTNCLKVLKTEARDFLTETKTFYERKTKEAEQLQRLNILKKNKEKRAEDFLKLEAFEQAAPLLDSRRNLQELTLKIHTQEEEKENTAKLLTQTLRDIEEQEAGVKNADNLKNKNKQNLESLREHIDRNVRPLDNEILKQSEKLEGEQKALAEKQAKMEEIIRGQQSADSNLSKVKKNILHTENFILEKKPFENLNIDSLRALFKNHEENINDLTRSDAQLTEGEELLSKLRKEISETSEQLKQAKEQVREVSEQEEELRAKAGEDIESRIKESETKIEDAQKNLQCFTELKSISENFYRIEEEGRVLKESYLKNKNREETLSKDKEHQEILHKNIIQKVEAQQKVTESQKLIMSLEEHRQNLKDGEPCPLCGSKNHPFKLHSDTIVLSEEEEKLNAYREEEKTVAAKLRLHENELSGISQVLIKEKKELFSKAEQLKKIYTDYAAKAEGTALLQDDKPASPELISSETAMLHQKKQECQHTLNELKLYVENLNKTEKELQKVKNAESRLSDNLNYLRDKQESTEVQRQKDEENIQKQRLKQKELREEIGLQLEFLGENTELLRLQDPTQRQAKTEAFLKKQQEIKERFQKAKQVLQDFEKEEVRLNSELSALQNLSAETAEALKEKTAEAELTEKQRSVLRKKRYELFEDRKPETELLNAETALQKTEETLQHLNAKLSTSKEQHATSEAKAESITKNIEQLSTELSGKKAEFAGKMSEKGITDEEYFFTSLISPGEADTLKKDREALEDQIRKCKHSLEFVRNELREQEERFSEGLPSVEEAESKFNNYEKTLTEAERELILILRKLEQHDEALRANREKQKEFNAQKAVRDEWQQLSDLIGSSKGDGKFRTFAQSLTLGNLIFHANRYLIGLNERYRISHEPGDEDLKMFVTDTYQGDAVRTLNTLSGGETFLVSLSLALALSDLASRNSRSRIQSLFIDEGFGTLDPKTLDDALDTLEKLQVSGRMIGIISHVEALKERINTQVQVVKKSGGFSLVNVTNA